MRAVDDVPPIGYGKTGDGFNIAYHTMGAGPPVVIFDGVLRILRQTSG